MTDIDMNRKLKDGEPCAHPGCLSHVSHPCEGCGRINGRLTSEQMSRQVCEALGICWHEITDEECFGAYVCSCGEVIDFRDCEEHKALNPSFSNDAGAVALLRLMMEKGFLGKFLNGTDVGVYEPPDRSVGIMNDSILIEYDYLTTPGKMLKAVHEWFKEKGVIK